MRDNDFVFEQREGEARVIYTSGSELTSDDF